MEQSTVKLPTAFLPYCFSQCEQVGLRRLEGGGGGGGGACACVCVVVCGLPACLAMWSELCGGCFGEVEVKYVYNMFLNLNLILTQPKLIYPNLI